MFFSSKLSAVCEILNLLLLDWCTRHSINICSVGLIGDHCLPQAPGSQSLLLFVQGALSVCLLPRMTQGVVICLFMSVSQNSRTDSQPSSLFCPISSAVADIAVHSPCLSSKLIATFENHSQEG